MVDLYSRVIVGWSMGNRIAGGPTVDALNQALGRWGGGAGVCAWALLEMTRGAMISFNGELSKPGAGMIMVY